MAWLAVGEPWACAWGICSTPAGSVPPADGHAKNGTKQAIELIQQCAEQRKTILVETEYLYNIVLLLTF